MRLRVIIAAVVIVIIADSIGRLDEVLIALAVVLVAVWILRAASRR